MVKMTKEELSAEIKRLQELVRNKQADKTVYAQLIALRFELAAIEEGEKFDLELEPEQVYTLLKARFQGYVNCNQELVYRGLEDLVTKKLLTYAKNGDHILTTTGLRLTRRIIEQLKKIGLYFKMEKPR